MSSGMRLRRLTADYEAVRKLVHQHPRIDIEGVSGNPPERYRFVLRVQSLRERGGEITRVHEHKLEVSLPRGYPRDAPVCRMLSPIFHPNIAPHAVCIGDHWSAAESLAVMVMRVGEMLAYQSYNTKSPLNGLAAQWAEENLDQIPLDSSEFFLDLETAPEPQAADATRCANCQADSGFVSVCERGHSLCADCTLTCSSCNQALCLACDISTCPTCAPPCANCGAPTKNSLQCPDGHKLCEDCAMNCQGCSAILCLMCGTYSCPSCEAQSSDHGP